MIHKCPECGKDWKCYGGPNCAYSVNNICTECAKRIRRAAQSEIEQKLRKNDNKSKI